MKKDFNSNNHKPNHNTMSNQQTGYNIPEKMTPEKIINEFQHAKDQWKERVKEIDSDASLYENDKKQIKYKGWQLLKKLRDGALKDLDRVKRQGISEKERKVFGTNEPGFSNAAKEFFDMKPDQLKDRIKYYSRIGDTTKVKAAAFQAQVDGHSKIVNEYVENADSDTQNAFQEYRNLKAEYNNQQTKLTESMKLLMPSEP